MERFREAGRINRMQFTARRQKLRDLCAVFLFLFLLPYACSLIFGGEDACRETLAVPASEGPMVACDGKAGTLLLPLEEYVEGALAASIPPEYEMETLKAQAVILRTLCLKAGETAEVISAASVGQRYLDAEQRRILWGEDYEEKQSRMEEAVRQTEGLVLTCGGELLEPAYFQLSAGKTRDGKEVLGEGYEYLVSVDCSHDVEAEDYSQSVVLSEERFRRTLGCGSEGKILLTRDSADYVLYVDTEAGRMSGESFRDLFGLSSSCFVLEQEGDSIRLTSRGIGHGLGFCQNEADRRAAQGEDYMELLSDFFKGAKIRKI
ncbi:MAG TPA: SpoIID/LytB domain-containing protein [Candidatus Eisenbergiella stercorigallinarum]|uniref:SpoIID/LytB domain-containing protein n=1 Tax=Candidatus Eisenbergiella stercorigallinarum TaxID=2838557 RepID=A0A9D2R2C3_9FIRM|nr:SpoIID/LytB domain-containing protein [Candidatus Eisenbergiella stercorigallinarum]